MKTVLFAIVTITSALSPGAMRGEPPTKIHCIYLNNEAFTVDIDADHFTETIEVNDDVSETGQANVKISGPGLRGKYQGIVNRKEHHSVLLSSTRYQIDLGNEKFLDLNYRVQMGEVIQEWFTGKILLDGNINKLTCNYKPTNI
jgi:hypothetical protein